MLCVHSSFHLFRYFLWLASRNRLPAQCSLNSCASQLQLRRYSMLERLSIYLSKKEKITINDSILRYRSSTHMHTHMNTHTRMHACLHKRAYACRYIRTDMLVIQSIIHSLDHSFVHPSIRPSMHPCILASRHPLIHFIQSITHALTLSFHFIHTSTPFHAHIIYPYIHARNQTSNEAQLCLAGCGWVAWSVANSALQSTDSVVCRPEAMMP